MNLDKYTERSKGMIQAAQTIALRSSHQQFTPEHVLKALLDDPEGLASNLMQAAGADAKTALAAVQEALAKIPAVEGDSGQLYLTK